MERKVHFLSTQDVSRLIGNNSIQLIDIRPVDAYNGWKMNNEKRSGHIKGAKSLPLKWTNYIDWIEQKHTSEHASYYGVMLWVLVMLEQWMQTHRP